MVKLLAIVLFAATIGYEGRIAGRKSGSLPVVTFRLWNAETGGRELWARKVAVSLDGDGRFSTELSDAIGSDLPGETKGLLDAALLEGQASGLWISTAVDDGEPGARVRLAPVPLALHAEATVRMNGEVEVGDVLSADALAVPAGDSNSVSVGGNLNLGGSDAVEDLSTGRLQVTGNAQGASLDVKDATLTVLGSELRAANVRGADASVVTTRVLKVTGGTFKVRGGDPSVRVGMIAMWSGESVPDGWAICDGRKVGGFQTPDLTGRFLMGGKGNSSEMSTMNLRTVMLEAEHLPEHTHAHKFGMRDYSAAALTGNKEVLREINTKPNAGGTNLTLKTSFAGGGLPHDNLPPYYALYYIIKVK